MEVLNAMFGSMLIFIGLIAVAMWAVFNILLPFFVFRIRKEMIKLNNTMSKIEGRR